MFSYVNSTALITGASRGIGAEIARSLAKRGIRHLILTARTESDLEAVANELAIEMDTPVTTILADLSQPEGAQKIYDEVKRHDLTVDLLINNAGFGYYGEFESAESGRDERMIAVNVESLVALTRLFLPAMKARNYGGIIHVASTAGFMPVPYMALYGATKAFVLSFSEALWAECRKSKVRVVCLCPGGTETAFDFGDKPRGGFENSSRSSPQEVAEAALDALDKDLSHVTVGAGNTLMTFVPRLLPRRMTVQLVAQVFAPRTDNENTEKKGIRKPILIAATGLALLTAFAIPAILRTVKNRES